MELILFYEAFVGLELTLNSILKNIVFGGELTHDFVFTLGCTRFAWNKADAATDIKLMTCHGTQPFTPFPAGY